MILYDRMKKNEFGYAVTDSPRLSCKILALENDWEASLIRDPDHQNAKQTLNEMVLWCKTQSKKMMRYVNKQTFARVRDKARNSKITY